MLIIHLWLLGLRLRIQGGPAAFLKDICKVTANCSVVGDSSYDALMFMTAAAATEGVRDQTSLHPRAVGGIESSALITSKATLSTLASAMRWPFHPEHMDFPTATTTAGVAADPALDAPFSWIAKLAPHREVRILEFPSAARAAPNVVQRRVTDPWLIDGTAFDLGVYAFIVQPPRGTARVTILEDDVLLRFCSAPFLSIAQAREVSQSVSDAAHVQSVLRAAWLVSDAYRSPWEMPSLAPLLRGGDTPPTSSKVALKALVATLGHGVTWERLWDQLTSIITRVASVVSATEAAGDVARFDLLRCEALCPLCPRGRGGSS